MLLLISLFARLFRCTLTCPGPDPPLRSQYDTLKSFIETKINNTPSLHICVCFLLLKRWLHPYCLLNLLYTLYTHLWRFKSSRRCRNAPSHAAPGDGCPSKRDRIYLRAQTGHRRTEGFNDLKQHIYRKFYSLENSFSSKGNVPDLEYLILMMKQICGINHIGDKSCEQKVWFSSRFFR